MNSLEHYAAFGIAMTIAAAPFAFGCWLGDRGIERKAPSFVDDAHLADYRYWYAEWCKAVEWLQRNPRAPTFRRPDVPPVIATGSIVAIDFKRRTRRAA